jgi:hypothetical protein
MTREEAQRGLDIIDEALSDVVGGRFPTRNSVCTPGGEVTQQVITVAGKIVYTTLEELVSPNHTALVVMDMQRDFCSPGGVFDRRGIDISMYPALTERVAHLLRGARDAGVTVIYVCMTVLPNRASESPAQIRFNMRLHQEVLTEVSRSSIQCRARKGPTSSQN